jgi:hypothetical protein
MFKHNPRLATRLPGDDTPNYTPLQRMKRMRNPNLWSTKGMTCI